MMGPMMKNTARGGWVKAKSVNYGRTARRHADSHLPLCILRNCKIDLPERHLLPRRDAVIWRLLGSVLLISLSWGRSVISPRGCYRNPGIEEIEKKSGALGV